MKCPTPTKRAYRDRIAALIVLAKITTDRPQGHDETRAYRCPCGRWHLASPKAVS